MPAADRRLPRQSVPESLRESLQERILSGEFGEGDALIQDAIAAEYDVSRMPVREALRQLEALGLVAMRTHRGAIVTSIPTEQIDELFDLRATLECALLGRAIQRMNDRDIAEAATILDRLGTAYRKDDMAGWSRLNWAFHERLYAPADRPQTLAILRGINLQIERYVRLHLLLTDGLANADREHRRLLDLCTLRDSAGATAFLRDHILGTGRTLLAALRQHRTAG